MNPQVFEVVNLEESDVILEDAQVHICDILNHDDGKTVESVINHSIVVG